MVQLVLRRSAAQGEANRGARWSHSMVQLLRLSHSMVQLLTRRSVVQGEANVVQG